VSWESFVATAVARFTAAAITDRGRKRGSNEDAFGYSIEHGIYLVCDGMGGAAAGEIASSLAVDEVLRLVAEHWEEPDSASGRVPEIARDIVDAVNEAIYSRGQRNARLTGMGTTLVGLMACQLDDQLDGQSEHQLEENRRIWILNVGDSRCYRLRNRRIEQCTHDHSLVEEQIRLGRMTRAEAARSPLRNVITRALGTQSSVTPDIIEVEVEPGDLFLLCSDGLSRELSDEKIASILNASSPDHTELEELCTHLIQAANKAGGHDNITCLLVRVN
jgi:PPM family protein phosphatase